MLGSCRHRIVFVFLFSLVFCLIAENLLSQRAVYSRKAQPQYPRALTGGKNGKNYMHNYYLPRAGTSTPWWPSWSPDGEWIAFSLQGSIWKMRTGESTAYELVHSEQYLSSPEWSPDGRHLVFTAEEDSQSINLKLLDLKTEKVTDLTSGDHLNLDPAWSPDGSKLAYVSTRPTGYFNIFIMEIRNGQAGEKTQVTRDHSYGKSRLYFGDHDLHIQPTWSPDGREIIFVSNRDILLGSGAIWRMPAVLNGIDRARLIHKEETLFQTSPHWSPDGKRIIYSSYLGGQFNNLFVLPVGGGEPYKMTFGEWDGFHPRWSPDGEWILYLSNQEGLPQLRLLKTHGGLQKKLEVKSLRWKSPVGRVHVRIRDALTGEVVGARIYAQASDGKTYVPEGTFHRRARRLNEHCFHSGGDFVLEVPAGPLVVEAMRGFEYYPAARSVQVESDRTTSVTIDLRRMVNLEAEGWYSGSNHVHMNYGGDLHNTPENLIFMAETEDLDVVGELVANKDNRVLDHQFFTGKPHPLSDHRHLLYFNEEYRPPFYGHVSLINLTRHLISPFTTGYEGTAIESLYPSNTDILRFAREQGALGAYVHPYDGDEDPLETDLGTAKGFPVDAALGTLAYHEQSNASWAAYRVWHHALNNGFRIPLAGGEDSMSDLRKTSIMGQLRTYAYLGSDLTWSNWIKAIGQGRSFVTNGPLLKLFVNDRMSGEEVHLPVEGGTLQIRGTVQSIVPLDDLDLVINGEAVPLGPLSGYRDPDGEGTLFSFTRELKITESSWITLQASASGGIHPVDGAFPQATTNPIWILVGDQPVRSEASADYFMRWIDKLTQMALSHPGWRSQKEKEHVLGQFQEAHTIYKGLREEGSQLSRSR